MTRTTPEHRILIGGLAAGLLAAIVAWWFTGPFFDPGPADGPTRPESLPARPDWLPTTELCAVIAGVAVFALAAGILVYNRRNDHRF